MGNASRFQNASTIAALVLLSSCDQRASEPSRDPFQDTQIAALSQRVEKLEADAATDPTLKRSDTGFTPIMTDIGVLTFQLKGVVAEGSGSRVRLQIGNPTSATVKKMTIYGHWGALTKDGTPGSDAHSMRQPIITATVNPGSWAEASFLLEGAKPADVGYLYISSVMINTLSLGWIRPTLD